MSAPRMMSGTDEPVERLATALRYLPREITWSDVMDAVMRDIVLAPLSSAEAPFAQFIGPHALARWCCSARAGGAHGRSSPLWHGVGYAAVLSIICGVWTRLAESGMTVAGHAISTPVLAVRMPLTRFQGDVALLYPDLWERRQAAPVGGWRRFCDDLRGAADSLLVMARLSDTVWPTQDEVADEMAGRGWDRAVVEAHLPGALGRLTASGVHLYMRCRGPSLHPVLTLD